MSLCGHDPSGDIGDSVDEWGPRTVISIGIETGEAVQLSCLVEF